MGDREKPADLVALVQQLRSGASHLEKVKLLARGWRSLRRLSRAQRLEVARQLGLEGAEDLLEQLGDPADDTAAAALQEIVRQAEEGDPEQWQRLVEDLHQPQERRKLLGRSLRAVAAGLAGETPVPESPQPEEAPIPLPLPGESAAEEPVGKESLLEGVSEQPAGEPPRPLEPPEAAAASAESEAVVLEEAPETTESGPEPAPEVAVAEPLPESPLPGVEGKRPLPWPTAPPAGLHGALEAAPNLVGRLRLVRQRVEEARQLETEALQDLLETFPEGWARRRALTALLRAGVPVDFEAALSLVAAQERPSARLWCLAALADSRSLTPDEEQRLLATVTSPTMRRRLEARISSRQDRPRAL
jgi:hypothetical protein